MLTVEEARARVLAAFGRLDTVAVPVGEAQGLVVAEDLVAPHPLPRFDNSAMDGYAVLTSDTTSAGPEAPVVLEVIGEVRAGDPGANEVVEGVAVRIMTGAPLPPGADGIVPVEDTEESGSKVSVKAPALPGVHIRPAGDDIAQGDTVVHAGTELGPGELALIASLGLTPAPVTRPPNVAIVVTGEELVDPEVEPRPGQIRDSNGLALKALVESAGGRVTAQIRTGDTLEATLDALRTAAAAADLVVSSGGVSVGRYDFVKAAVESLGRIDMWRVAMQPGKPVVLGSVDDKPFLGLPGNPVSIHIGFEQFVRPAIRKMRGCRTLLRPVIRAHLTETVEKRPGRLHFVRVRLESGPMGWLATPTGPQGSHIQSSLIECDGVARFGIEQTRLDEGVMVEVEVWRLPGGKEGSDA